MADASGSHPSDVDPFSTENLWDLKYFSLQDIPGTNIEIPTCDAELPEIKSEVPFKPPLNLYDNIEAAPLQCASPFRPPDNLNSNPQSVGAGAGTDKRTISEAQQQDVWSLTPLENNEMSQASQSWDAFPMRPPGSKSPYVSEDALHGFAFLGLSP